MVINPFVAGVLATLGIEMLLFVIVVIGVAIKSIKKK